MWIICDDVGRGDGDDTLAFVYLDRVMLVDVEGYCEDGGLFTGVFEVSWGDEDRFPNVMFDLDVIVIGLVEGIGGWFIVLEVEEWSGGDGRVQDVVTGGDD